MALNRRALLQGLAASSVFLTAGSASRSLLALPAGEALSFPQGVASGDPQADGIMLWTRAEPSGGSARVTVQLQLSRSEDFSSLVLEKNLSTDRDSDYTLRVYVDGLVSGSSYYYRFLGPAGSQSRLGRTRTAPAADDPRPVNLAFASCQNYSQGHFGAWARMITQDKARDDAQQIAFVLHLGDFIYERYRDQDQPQPGNPRVMPAYPDGARDHHHSYALTLDDYRHAYKTYLSDPYLQAARARWPFVCTWDDHEFSNDGFQSVSRYGDEYRAQQNRRQDANQAWFEFIPAVLSERGPVSDSHHAHDFERRHFEDTELGPVDAHGRYGNSANHQAIASLCIYRRLRWGRHLDLLITDLRSYRSAPAIPAGLSKRLGLPLDPVELVKICDAGSSYNKGQPPATLPFGEGDIANPAVQRAPGTMMGEQQKSWFKQQLLASSASWKIWGNSLPALSIRLDLGSIPLAGYADGILSTDAWAGYPTELEELLTFTADNKVTGLVSLSGDHHMHGAAVLHLDPDQPDSAAVAVDFNCAGISSTSHWHNVLRRTGPDNPTFASMVSIDEGDTTLPAWNMSLQLGVMASLSYAKTGWRSLANWLGPNKANPGLQYVDTNAHGYGLVQIDASQLRAQLITVASPERDYGPQGPEIVRSAHFTLNNWSPTEQPELNGPSFTGTAPFPYDLGGNRG